WTPLSADMSSVGVIMESPGTQDNSARPVWVELPLSHPPFIRRACILRAERRQFQRRTICRESFGGRRAISAGVAARWPVPRGAYVLMCDNARRHGQSSDFRRKL